MDVISVHGLMITGRDDKRGLPLIFGNSMEGALVGSCSEEEIIRE